MKDKFRRPSAAVVSQCGYLFIKDDVCIKKFDSSLTTLKTFSGKSMGRPYGKCLVFVIDKSIGVVSYVCQCLYYTKLLSHNTKNMDLTL